MGGMSEGVGNQENYALRTDIITDFTKSVEQAEKYATELGKINAAIGKMHEATSGLSISIGKKITEAINELEGKGTLSINGESLMKKIQNDLVAAVNKRGVKLVGEGGKALSGEGVSPLNVEVRASTIDDLERKIKDYLKSRVDKVQLSDPSNFQQEKKLRIPVAVLEEARAKLIEKLVETLKKGGIVWTNAEGKAMPKLKLPMYFNEKDLAPLFKTLSQAIGLALGNPENITFSKLPKLDLSMVKIDDIVKFFEQEFKVFNEQFKELDLSALSKVPQIKAEVNKFLLEIAKIATAIIEAVKSVEVKDTKEAAGVIVSGLSGIGTRLLDHLKDLIQGADEAIKSYPVSTIGTAKIKGELKELTQIVNGFVQDRMRWLLTELDKEKSVKQLDVKGLGKLQRALSTVVISEEALMSLVEKVDAEISRAVKNIHVASAKQPEINIPASVVSCIYTTIARVIEHDLKKWNVVSSFSINTADLNSSVINAMKARTAMFQLSPEQFVDRNPLLEGKTGILKVVKGSLGAIMGDFNTFVAKQLGESVVAYNDAMAKALSAKFGKQTDGILRAVQSLDAGQGLSGVSGYVSQLKDSIAKLEAAVQSAGEKDAGEFQKVTEMIIKADTEVFSYLHMLDSRFSSIDVQLTSSGESIRQAHYDALERLRSLNTAIKTFYESVATDFSTGKGLGGAESLIAARDEFILSFERFVSNIIKDMQQISRIVSGTHSLQLSEVQGQIEGSYAGIISSFTALAGDLVKISSKISADMASKMSGLGELDKVLEGFKIDETHVKRIAQSIEERVNRLVNDINVAVSGIQGVTVKEDAVQSLYKKVIGLIEAELKAWVPGDAVKVFATEFQGRLSAIISGYLTKVLEGTGDIKLTVGGVGAIAKDGVTAVFNRLKQTIQEGVNALVDNYLDSLKSSPLSLVSHSVDVAAISKVNESLKSKINELLFAQVNAALSEIEKVAASSKGVDVKAFLETFNDGIRVFIQGRLNQAVTEAAAVLSSTDMAADGGVGQIVRKAMTSVMEKFSQSISSGVTANIDAYKGAVDQVSIVPDTTAVQYLVDGLNNFQHSLASKVKQILDAQLNPFLNAVSGFTPAGTPVPIQVVSPVPIQIVSPSVVTGGQVIGGTTPINTSILGGGPAVQHAPPSMPGGGGGGSIGGAFSPPLSFEEFDNLAHLNLKNAYARVENIKNKFREANEDIRKGLEQHLNAYVNQINYLYGQYGVYLEQAHQERLVGRGQGQGKELSEQDKEKQSQDANMYREYLKLQNEAIARLNYAVETFKRQTIYSKYDQQADNLKEDALINKEKLQNRFMGKLSLEEFHQLMTALNQYEAKVHDLSSKSIIDDQGAEHAKKQFTALKRELAGLGAEYDRIVKVGKGGYDINALARDIRLLDPSVIPAKERENLLNQLGMVFSEADFKEVKKAYAELLKIQEDGLRGLDGFAKRRQSFLNELGLYRDNAANATEKVQNRFFGKLPAGEVDALNSELEIYSGKVKELHGTPIINEQDLENARQRLVSLKRELEGIIIDYDRIAKASKLSYEKSALAQKIGLLEPSVIPVPEVTNLRNLINNAENSTDLKIAKDMYAELLKIQEDALRGPGGFDKKRLSMLRKVNSFIADAEVKSLGIKDDARLVLGESERVKLDGDLAKLVVQAKDLLSASMNTEEELAKVEARMKGIVRGFKRQVDSIRSMVSGNEFQFKQGELRSRFKDLVQIGFLESGELGNLGRMINRADSKLELRRAEEEYKRLLGLQKEAQRQHIEFVKMMDKLVTAQPEYQNKIDKILGFFRHKLTDAKYQELEGELNKEVMGRFQVIQGTQVDSLDKLKAIKNELQAINNELVRIDNAWRKVEQDMSFADKKSVLIEQIGLLRQLNKETGLVPHLGGAIGGLLGKVDAARSIGELTKYRDEYRKLLSLYQEAENIKEKERKRGEVLVSSPTLMGTRVLRSEDVREVLRGVAALEQYEIKNVRVNHATNVWSASLKDTENNVRTLTGLVDRSSGTLYKYAEALRESAKQQAVLREKIGATGNPFIADGGGYFSPDVMGGSVSRIPPHSFTTSVVNTIRYILSGWMLQAPIQLAQDTFELFKKFELETTRAMIDVVAKSFSADTGLGPNKYVDSIVAVRIANMAELSDVFKERIQDPVELQKVVADETAKVESFKGENMYRALQQIAYTYGTDVGDVAEAYRVAARRIMDPLEALAATSAIAKVQAFSTEGNIDVLAKGFEAVLSQWGISGYGLDKVANMMIMATMKSQATITDLIQVQQRSGALFRQALPNMSKEEAMATSIALSSIFVQATAQSGNIGGTFFKNILQNPYTPQKAEALTALSKNPAFVKAGIDFSPYIITEDGTRVKRNFVSLLGNLFDALKLEDEGGGRTDAMTASLLKKQVAQKWFEGSFTAVETTVAELAHSFDLAKHGLVIIDKARGKDTTYEDYDKMKSEDVLKEYTKAMQEATPQQASTLMAMQMGTLEFQQRRLKVAWDSASMNVFSEFKNNFTKFLTHLNILLRALDRNSEGVAAMIRQVAQLATVFGTKYVFDHFVKGKYQDFKKDRAARAINENVGMLNREGMGIDLRRRLLDKEMEEFKRQRYNRQVAGIKANEVAGELRAGLAAKEAGLAELYRQREVLKAQQQDRAKKGLGPDAKIAKELDANRGLINKSKRDISKDKAALKAQEKLVNAGTGDSAAYAKLEQEMARVQAQATGFNRRIGLVKEAMRDLGIEANKLKNPLTNVDEGFRSIQVDASLVEKEFSKIASRAGVTANEFKKIDEQLKKLDRDFKSGAISAEKYGKEVHKLQRSLMTAEAGVPGGGISGMTGQAGKVMEQEGSNLLKLAAQGSLLYGGMKLLSGGGRGIKERWKDFKDTRDPRAFYGSKGYKRKDDGSLDLDDRDRPVRADGVRGAAGESDGTRAAANRAERLAGDTAGGSKLSKLMRSPVVGGLSKLAKGFGWMAVIPTALDVLGGLMDASLGTKADHINVTAQSLEAMTERAGQFSSAKNVVAKAFYGIGWGFDALADGIVHAVTGTRVSFSDHLDAFRQARKGDLKGEKLRESLKEQYGFEEMKVEAQRLIEEENYLLNLKLEADRAKMEDDLWKKVSGDAWANIYTEDQAGQLVSWDNKVWAHKNALNDAEYGMAKSRQLIAGFREDSDVVTRLTRGFFNKQIEALTENIAAYEKALNEMEVAGQKEDNPAYWQLENEMEAKKKQIEEFKLQEEMIQYDNVLSNTNAILERNKSNIQAQFTMQKDRLLIKGAAENSFSVRSINAQMYRAVNNSIEEAIGKLQAQMQTMSPGTEQYNVYYSQMLQLQAEQLDNLVKIRQELAKSPATFNLPAGIQPLTYWEAMTRNNTHRNVSVRSGDVIVNVTIDNMNGNTQDTERLAAAVGNAVRETQATVSNGLARQVTMGFGHNYNPHGVY